MQKNYFEIFNLPEDFELDEEKLHTAYRACQLVSHPDRVGATARPAPAQAGDSPMQHATLLNDAYRTLRDPVKRALYLLTLRDMSVDLETDTKLDPHFLVEQLELRETLQELSASPKNQEALSRFRAKILAGKQEKIGAFLIAYREQDYAAARNTVRELQFFGRLDEQVRDLLC